MNLEELLVQTKSYNAINLRSLESGHIWIEAELNNTPGQFIIDTGAGSTVIDTSSKEKFGLESTETDELATGAGSKDIGMQIASNLVVTIGALELEEFEVFLMDLSHVNNSLQEKCNITMDGVIGADVLKRAAAVIDYKSMKMFLKQEIKIDEI